MVVCVGWFLILGLSDLADVWSGDRVAKCSCPPSDTLCTGPQVAAAIASTRRKAWPLLLVFSVRIPHFHSLWVVSMMATDLKKLRKNWWWLAEGARGGQPRSRAGSPAVGAWPSAPVTGHGRHPALVGAVCRCADFWRPPLQLAGSQWCF